jgi:Lipocalin-like domain
MRRIILAVALASIVGLPAKAQSLRDQLVGAWSHVSCDIKGFPWCVSPHDGIAILDASGHYAIINTVRGRPKFRDAQSSRDSYSAEEYKAATVGLQAQYGTWSVDEAGKALILHVNGALFPNVEGGEGRQTISVSGDEITLVNAFGGSNVWRRIKK